MSFSDIHKYILILLMLIITTKISNAEMTTSQIAEEYSPSVVTIVALDENDQPLALGSGFFINGNGDIATNHHVLEGCFKAIIKTRKGDKGNVVEILKDDPELDLVIASTSLKDTKPIPFGDSDTITVGEDIIAIGNPAGLEGTISKGIISGIRKVDDSKFIQITASISPGSSGGPVFNLSGKVIGIATAYLDYGQSLNFAMPINYLNSLKPLKLNLASLPKKSESKSLQKDGSLVQVFEVYYHYNQYGGEDPQKLTYLDFAVKNIGNYPIKNIQIFFIYKNYHGEIVSYSAKKIEETLLSKLALQFSHNHGVKYFRNWSQVKNVYLEGEVEIRILDYEIDRISEASPSDLLFK